jgi:ABC-type nitrate/sulfonate/bicarbonate transport system permease component
VSGTARRLAIRLLVQLLVVAAVFGIWQWVTVSAASPYYLPPTRIVAAMYRQWFDGPASHLWLTADARANLLPSLELMLAGWAIASAAGIVLGIAIGRLPLFADLAEPIVHFGRAVPPPVMVPVFLFLLRIGTQMETATIIFGVIWPVLLNTIDGTRHVHPVHMETARAFRLSPAQRLFRIIVPSAAPKIFAGLRLGLALALIMMVVAELDFSTRGIGYEMGTAQSTFNVPLMWAIIVLLGVLGIVLNAIFILIERSLLSWRQHA